MFPEVDAIQFRMHEESGLEQHEIVTFWHEVFGFFKESRPDLRLDRMKSRRFDGVRTALLFIENPAAAPA
jgi:hypothetical protein